MGRVPKNETINIYGQEIWHDDVLIMSTRESLIKLKDAIDKALREGTGIVEQRASDERSYTIQIKEVEAAEPVWEEVELPYRMFIAKDDSKTVKKEDILG